MWGAVLDASTAICQREVCKGAVTRLPPQLADILTAHTDVETSHNAVCALPRELTASCMHMSGNPRTQPHPSSRCLLTLTLKSGEEEGEKTQRRLKVPYYAKIRPTDVFLLFRKFVQFWKSALCYVTNGTDISPVPLPA